MNCRLAVRILGIALLVLCGDAAAATTSIYKATAHMTSADVQRFVATTRERAQAGDEVAEYNLGVLFSRGIGVNKSYSEARRWYEKSAAQRYGRAEQNLGILYESGEGVTANSKAAAHWFRRGADDGQAASANNLGVLYMKGDGVPQDTSKAAYWTALAAAAGNRDAIQNLPRITQSLPQARVESRNVYIRKRPEPHSLVVEQIASAIDVVVLHKTSDWTEVLLPTRYKMGWIENDALDRDTALSARSTTEAPRTMTARLATTPSGHETASSSAREHSAASARPAEKSTASQLARANAGEKEAAERQAAEKRVKERKAAEPKTAVHKTEEAASSSDQRRVGVSGVNLRAAPSRAGKRLGQLARGDIVTVEKHRNGWMYVTTPRGVHGWVAGYLLVDTK